MFKLKWPRGGKKKRKTRCADVPMFSSHRRLVLMSFMVAFMPCDIGGAAFAVRRGPSAFVFALNFRFTRFRQKFIDLIP